jgi:hypothetical protein
MRAIAFWPSVSLAMVVAVAPLGAAAETLTFKWPVPGKVVVTEKVMKKGMPATLRYDVTVTPAPDRKRLAVRLTGMQFVDVGGRDARDPEMRKMLAGALQMAAAIPTVLITREGEFDDVTDVDRMIDEVARIGSMPAGQRAAVVKMMKSPQMQPLIKERSADFWNVWVGMWAGAELEPGRTIDLSVPMALPGAAPVDRPLKVTHHGPAGPPAHVRLSFESRLDGDGTTKALQGFVGSLLQQMETAEGAKVGPEMFERFQMVSAGEVVTDPATLRPVSARTEKRVVVKVKGQPPQSQVESHEYTFAWPKAAPAGKR